MRWLGYLGKFLISVGVGVLLFVAWTLWGTGIYTRQQQQRLSQAWAGQASIEPHVVRISGIEFRGPPKSYLPDPGKAVFRIKIPAINISKMVVEGVSDPDLALGPGHYPSCRPGFPPPLCTPLPEVWPGERGRVIISGHRTTHDHPFYDIDKLKPGDDIITVTHWGTFTYEVTQQKVVAPSSTEIANPRPGAKGGQIVLTTCNPKYSAAQRLIVFGKLVTST